MGVNFTGSTNVIAEVDPRFKAVRTSNRPPEVSAWSSFAAASGLVTLAAAGSVLFSMRNNGGAMLMVRRISIAWVQTAAFTAAQRMEWGLYIARAITTPVSGGTAVGSGKHRGSLNGVNLDALIATTGGMTAGAATVDTQPIGMAAAWCTQGNPLALTDLLRQDAGDHPVFLTANEGLRIQTLQTMSAGGVGVLYVNGELAECTEY